jgi:hypothetical protein
VLVSVVAIAWRASAEPAQAWVARMDAFAALVAQLLPDAFANERAAVPTGESAAIEARLQQSGRALAALAPSVSTLAAHGAADDADPTIPLLIGELKGTAEEMTHAHGELLSDDAAFVAATCIGCHTRTSRGAARPRAELAPVDATLPSWVRADIFAATRRIEPARRAYREAVFDEELAAREPYLWERAVRHALVVEVRVAHDPVGALDVAEQVLQTPAGRALWEDAAIWSTSLRAWAKEPRPSTSADAFDEARAAMDRAEAVEKTPRDGGAFIEYLRATAALHRAFATGALREDQRAQALDWLGQAYESLPDVDVWSLYELYDEACVEAAPHTSTALACYTRLERNVMIDERGNSGVDLPETSAQRLARLHDLAKQR